MTPEEKKEFKHTLNQLYYQKRPISKSRDALDRNDTVSRYQRWRQKIGSDEQLYILAFYHHHCKGIPYRTAALAHILNLSPGYFKDNAMAMDDLRYYGVAKERYVNIFNDYASRKGVTVDQLTVEDLDKVYEEIMNSCPPPLMEKFNLVLEGIPIVPTKKMVLISATSHQKEHSVSVPDEADPRFYNPLKFYIYFFHLGEDTRWNTRPGVTSYKGKIDDPIPAQQSGWHVRFETDGFFQFVDVRTSKQAYNWAINFIKRAYGGIKL